MTEKEWKECEEKLSGTFGAVDLNCDGYRVSIVITVLNRLLVYAIYVNGWVKGEWMLKDCEERRRFMSPKKTWAFSGRYRKTMLKAIEKYGRNCPYSADINYFPWWKSFDKLKKHLIANNKSIEFWNWVTKI